jgi:aspartyl aminopeptidase
LLQDTLGRICDSDENLKRALSHSMLVSADNAHGVHPNYGDKHEPEHKPLMNAGPVIKINHNQRYATNSETEGVFRQICASNKLPVQTIVVRSDMGCGSTIGPITATRLGVRAVDVGVPQLGMHSIRELAGAVDHDTLTKALKGFFKFSPWPF